MADLSKLAVTSMEMLEDIEQHLEEGDEIGELMVLVQVKGRSESLTWRCSSQDYLIQQGLLAWANTAIHTSFTTEEDDD